MKTPRSWLILFIILALLDGVAWYFWDTYYADKKPVEMTVAAGPAISDSYLLMTEISEVIARHNPHIILNVQATGGSSQNIQLLQAGKADFAVVQSSSPAVSRAQLVAHLYPNIYLLLAHPDSGIENIGDLVGRRVAVPPFGSGDLKSFWQIGDHYDLPIEKLQWLAMPLKDAIVAMEQHRVDAIFLLQAPRNAPLIRLIEDMAISKRPLPRFIPVDQGDAMALKRPFLQSNILPKGTYLGAPPVPARDVPTVGIEQLLLTREETDPELVQALTEILFEQRGDILLRTPLAKHISSPNLDTGGASLTVHEGAERYYLRNEPSFLQENAEPLALVITVIGIGGSALLGLRKKFSSTQKNQADSFNLDVLAIGRRAASAESLTETRTCKQELQSILERMIDDLDNDLVTEDGFQSFALTWEAVRDLINDRVRELEKKA